MHRSVTAHKRYKRPVDSRWSLDSFEGVIGRAPLDVLLQIPSHGFAGTADVPAGREYIRLSLLGTKIHLAGVRATGGLDGRFEQGFRLKQSAKMFQLHEPVNNLFRRLLLVLKKRLVVCQSPSHSKAVQITCASPKGTHGDALLKTHFESLAQISSLYG